MATPARLMVDIHCHMLPGIDDGAPDLETSLEMARMAVNDGIGTVICTPHQLGNFRRNQGEEVRAATASFQEQLQKARIPLRVLPGGDVRIEASMVAGLAEGTVVSLADQRKHVLLELPHELYFPLEPVLEQLRRVGMIGILSHPERNRGILENPQLIPKLVDSGCLMQVTAGSLLGSMGTECQTLARWMLEHGLIHFMASDAHGIKNRRPLLRRAFDETVQRCDEATAQDLFVRNPACVALGKPVAGGRRPMRSTSENESHKPNDSDQQWHPIRTRKRAG